MKIIPPIAACLLTSVSVCAQIFLNVDPIRQEYFLSGSASGVPSAEFLPFHISWDNNQPTGGGLVNLLDINAFRVSGQEAFGFIMFLNGNGNVNGALFLASDDPVTLTGDSSRRYDYSFFDPPLVSQLERKAEVGEFLPTVSGSPSFGITFVAVPEPSTLILLIVTVGLAFLLPRLISPAAAGGGRM
jgi:hypothetical protein